MSKVSRKAAAQAFVVLLLAGSIKLHYSVASVNELWWVLGPTRLLVERITGTRFQFESHAGYMSDDRSFLIAASCAGVNFLIAAFLMISLGRLWKVRGEGPRWVWIPSSALLAYALTIVANSLRISSALWLISCPQRIAGLDREEVHRIDGILIYFGILLLVFIVAEESKTSASSRSACRYLFPLGSYYAMTLAVPIVNGAFLEAGFWHHALFVLCTPIVMISGAALSANLLSRDPERKDVSAAVPPIPGHLGIDEVRT